jgi:hypothetical protein
MSDDRVGFVLGMLVGASIVAILVLAWRGL